MINVNEIAKVYIKQVKESKKEAVKGMTDEEVLKWFNKVKRSLQPKKVRQDLEGKLEELARELLYEQYNLDLDIPIVLNGRTKLRGGAFSRVGEIDSNGKLVAKANNIEISINTVITSKMIGDEGYLIDTLKHELTHYALFILGKPFQENDKEFIKAINDWGASYYHDNFAIYKRHECKDGCKIDRMRKIPSTHICTKHGNKIEYVYDFVK